MMGYNYAKLAATAVKILAKYGTVGQIGDGSAMTDVKVVRNKNITHEFDNTKVVIGDVEYVMEGGAAPEEGQVLVVAGERMVIVSAIPVKPADVIVIWFVYGRSG